MNFEWKRMNLVSQKMIDDFDCGDYSFNTFFKEQASKWMDEGYAITYVAVDGDEFINNSVTRIYAYASINATGLLYKDGDSKYLSCAEIRMFAVSRFLRGKEAVDLDGIRYSYKIFQTLMQQLYEISTKVIGFTAVTLNANNNGIKLYKDFGFVETDEYLLPEEEEKIDIEGCVPLIFSLIGEDVLEKLFC